MTRRQRQRKQDQRRHHNTPTVEGALRRFVSRTTGVPPRYFIGGYRTRRKQLDLLKQYAAEAGHVPVPTTSQHAMGMWQMTPGDAYVNGQRVAKIKAIDFKLTADDSKLKESFKALGRSIERTIEATSKLADAHVQATTALARYVAACAGRPGYSGRHFDVPDDLGAAFTAWADHRLPCTGGQS